MAWLPTTLGAGGTVVLFYGCVMLIGETPGDREDVVGRPFVGPAGRLLDRALEAAGIDRSTVYLTNVVKHFKFEPRGKRRLHKKPLPSEIGACLPWLRMEIELVRPKIIVCLGATAGQALLGSRFSVTRERVRQIEQRALRRLLQAQQGPIANDAAA